MVTTTVTVDKLMAAISNAGNYDTIECIGGGMALVDGGVQPWKAQGLTINAYGATLRRVMHAQAYVVDEQRIAAMSILQIPGGSYASLTPQDKARVDAYIQANRNMDYSGVTTAANQFLATLKPITELWRNANPVTAGEITYNGKSYLLPIHWTAIYGDILTPRVGVWNTTINGITLENAKIFNNAAAVHGTGGSVWLQDSTMRDCDNGARANAAGLAKNANGDLFYDYPPTRFTAYCRIVGKNNLYDGCGSNGIAHAFYHGGVLYTIEFGSTAINMNAGNAYKFVSGVQLAFGCKVIDKGNTFAGVLEPGDFDSGYAGVFNCEFEKWTAGTGNTGEVILMRNGRQPVAPWFENALCVRGCTLTYGLNHQAWFIRALEEPAFNYGWSSAPYSMKPTPIRTRIRDNVFICPPGYPVGKTPILIGTGPSDVGNNQLNTTNDPVPDVRVSLPNDDFNQSTWRQWVSDALSVQDPGTAPWLSRVTAMPLYPPGVTV
jgi:hypothetical protein